MADPQKPTSWWLDASTREQFQEALKRELERLKHSRQTDSESRVVGTSFGKC